MNRKFLQKMLERVAYRCVDGSGIWTQGGIGLAHGLRAVTEESVGETQPMTNGRGLWITADGRIDNRQELRREFISHGLWEANAALPDTVCILLAYEVWGEQAPGRLLGDFAFVIWDDRDQTLFCARDPIGLKPFFYHWNRKRLIFGSELKQILQDPGVSTELDLLHLTDLILMSFPHREGTPYQSIRRLAPGHFLRVNRTNLEIRRYFDWNPDSEPPSRVSLKESAEGFREVFREAVRARLRIPSGRRAGSLLSGGLDSSSIVAMASPFQQEFSRPAAPFPVFTLFYPEANPSYQLENVDWVDESSYVATLRQRYLLESHRIEMRGRDPLENIDLDFCLHDGPLVASPTLSDFRPLLDAAVACDVRALFHGEGGDELFQVGTLPKPASWGWVPEKPKALYRRFFRSEVPDFLQPVFARRHHLRERIEADPRRDPALCRSNSRGLRLWFSSGFVLWLVEANERMAASRGIEVRYPFVDLRLFQHVSAIPGEWKRKEGFSKFLLREAMEGILPETIRMRRRKAEFSPVERSRLERYALTAFQETLERPHPILASIVRISRARRLYRHWFVDRPSTLSGRGIIPLRQLWLMVQMDQWLKFRQSSFGKS